MNGRRLLAALAVVPIAYALVRAAVVRRVHGYERLDGDTAVVPGVRLYLRGRRVHLTIEGQGPPLLMIHGFGASGAAFRRLAPLLREQMTLITPDLPGFGYSERSPEADHSHEANAALMLALLDRLGVTQAAVLGHSVGAAVALRMAVSAPERMAALILAGGPGRNPALPRWWRPLLTIAVPPTIESRRGQRWLNRSAMARGSSVDEATLSGYLREARVRGHAATLVAMLVTTRFGPAPDVRTLKAPTLIITGVADRYFPPAQARSLAGTLPSAEVLVIEGAGHLVLEEQPEQTAAAILGFLRGLQPPSALPSDGTTPVVVIDAEAAGI